MNQKKRTLEIGIEGKQSLTVSDELTAAAMGSGELPIYATPAVVELIENTAMNSIRECLEDGQGSVGTRIDIRHISASPVGMAVSCCTKLIEIDRKRLVFKTTVSDFCGLIAEGIHERFIIDQQQFLEKAQKKSISENRF